MIVCARPLKITVLPELEALRNAIADVPSIVKVALLDCVKLPVPLREEVTVKILLFMSATPFTVRFGIVYVPVRDCEFVLKV